jgi:oligoendopeptidase F
MSVKFKTNWDLSKLYHSENDPQIENDILESEDRIKQFVEKWKSNDKYLTDPIQLKQALDEYEEILRESGMEGKAAGYYLHLRLALNKNDKEIKAKTNKLHERSIKLLNSIRFFTHRLSKISEDTQKTFLNADILKEYKYLLEKIFLDGKYLLSEDEEKILTLKHKTSKTNWTEMVNSILTKQEREVLTEEGTREFKGISDLGNLLESKNDMVRNEAETALNSIYESWLDVAEAEMNNIVENKKVDDELRGFQRPDQARHIDDEIDSEVVDAMINAVAQRYSISQRFYKLKAKLLGKEKLKYSERNLHIGEVNSDYTYDQSAELVLNVFSKLDKEFVEISERLFDGYVDVYPSNGKEIGAFCTYNLKNHPIFVLLNFTGKLRDVSTLAHEFGHAIHFEMSKVQNSLNSGATTATAEVASTFMEDFVFDEILQDRSDEEKLSLIMDKLNDQISTIQRQVACYKFEQELHKTIREKGYVSKEEIGKIFEKNMTDYLGDYVEFDEGTRNWWVGWSHIRKFFYVYSYASGLLISKGLQKIVKENNNNIEKVKLFFRTGISKSTKDIFMDAGLDISNPEFWFKGLDEIEELVSQAEELANNLGY